MKDKQFNLRLSNDDLEVLSNLSQKLHLPYSKCIILALHLLNDFVYYSFNGKEFNHLDMSDYNAILFKLNRWKKIM